jgi:alpha-ribazole phosphatase
MPTPVPVSSERPDAPRLWLLRHAAVEGTPGLCYGASDLAAQPAATRAAADDFARRWPAAPESLGTAVAMAECDVVAIADADHNDGDSGVGGTADIADPRPAVPSITPNSAVCDIRLWCSPLRRCTALAAAVVERLPRLGPVRVDARLVELDFGDWEGQPWDAIGRDAFDAWTADFADARAGGQGESTRMFMARVGAAWDAWRASGRDAVWVTHAGVMRAVMLLDAGVRCPEAASQWPANPILYGGWFCIGNNFGNKKLNI